MGDSLRCSRGLLVLVAAWIAGASMARAQGPLATPRLEVELGGELAVGFGHYCHPPSGPADDAIECGDNSFIPGGSLAAMVRPLEHLGIGVFGAAGASILMNSTETDFALYRLALEARYYARTPSAGGFHVFGQLGIAWADPSDSPSDRGPWLGLGVAHAWAPWQGLGATLGIAGWLTIFGDAPASRVGHYGTLTFVGPYLRLNLGVPL